MDREASFLGIPRETRQYSKVNFPSHLGNMGLDELASSLVYLAFIHSDRAPNLNGC